MWTAKNDKIEIVLIGELHGHSFDSNRIPSRIIKAIHSANAIGEELIDSENALVSAIDQQGRKISSRINTQLWNRIISSMETVKAPNGGKFAIREFDELNPVWAAAVIESWGRYRSNQKPLAANSNHTMNWAAIIGKERRYEAHSVSLDRVEEKNNIWSYCDTGNDKTAALLRSALDSWEIEEYRIALKTTLPEAVDKGDIENIEAIAGSDSKFDYLKIIHECIIKPRNRIWLERMIEYAKKYPRTVYLVGIGHLLGQDGLVAMFRSRGFVVVQFGDKQE